MVTEKKSMPHCCLLSSWMSIDLKRVYPNNKTSLLQRGRTTLTYYFFLKNEEILWAFFFWTYQPKRRAQQNPEIFFFWCAQWLSSVFFFSFGVSYEIKKKTYERKENKKNCRREKTALPSIAPLVQHVSGFDIPKKQADTQKNRTKKTSQWKWYNFT